MEMVSGPFVFHRPSAPFFRMDAILRIGVIRR